MKLNELEQKVVEAVISPIQEYMSEIDYALDQANQEYQDYLSSNNDQDDIDYLAELIEDAVDFDDLDFEVHVNHQPRRDPNEWISAEAGVDTKGTFINLILHAKNLEGRWGPKTFKDVVMQTIGHETIHLAQYDRIGRKKLNKLKSGHQRGQEAAANAPEDQKAQIWMKHYLADPHEMMAYAYNLASEVSDYGQDVNRTLTQIEALSRKDQQAFPSYMRYRSVFEPNSKELKQLLKYTSQYLHKGE